MAKTIQQRKAELQAELDKLRAEEKKLADEKALIVGRVVNAALDEDEQLRAKVQELLAKKIRKNGERKLFGLEPIPTKRGRPPTSPPLTISQ